MFITVCIRLNPLELTGLNKWLFGTKPSLAISCETVVSQQSKGPTKGLRVINYVDPWVLKFNLDYSLVTHHLEILYII